MRGLIGKAVIVFGVMSSLLFFSAGYKLGKSGQELTHIRSVGGESVAEAYYQKIGNYGIACSNISYALGLGILAVSFGLGGPLFKEGM